jgi:hypothetical protein
MAHYELFGPRRLGWRPVTPQGWLMLWGSIAGLTLAALTALFVVR